MDLPPMKGSTNSYMFLCHVIEDSKHLSLGLSSPNMPEVAMFYIMSSSCHVI